MAGQDMQTHPSSNPATVVSATKYQVPPALRTEKGEIRRVGVELEFGGLNSEQAAQIVIEIFGGEFKADPHFAGHVIGARFGDFGVEVDSRFLKHGQLRDFAQKIGLENEAQSKLDQAVEAVASALIPSEIATPPIPIPDLEQLDALSQALRAHHALGTRAAPQYAFGLHFNPELAAPRNVETILSLFRAFLLLEDWLIQVSEIDRMRRMTSFIDPFPEDYRRLILAPAYQPQLEDFIEDYLSVNPTRNRSLDLLPCLAHIDSQRVLSRVGNSELVKPRPALHYRLPNCLIDETGWSPAQDWNRWVEVERLAEDSVRLKALSLEYLDLTPLPFRLHGREWADRMANGSGFQP